MKRKNATRLPRAFVRRGSSPRVSTANLATTLLVVDGAFHGRVRRLEGIQGGLQVRAFAPRCIRDFGRELYLLLGA